MRQSASVPKSAYFSSSHERPRSFFKSLFLNLRWDCALELACQRESEGVLYKGKTIIRFGQANNLNVAGEISQLSPEVQEIVNKCRNAALYFRLFLSRRRVLKYRDIALVYFRQEIVPDILVSIKTKLPVTRISVVVR